MDERGILVMTPEDVLALKLSCVDAVVYPQIVDSLSTVQKLDYENLLTEQLNPVRMIIPMTVIMK